MQKWSLHTRYVLSLGALAAAPADGILMKPLT